MATNNFFKSVFDELATNNYIGNPDGELAYCYLRVSTQMQSEEGRSGLPRQITNIHSVASESGYKIPWEFVFADDDTGFEFEQREQLSKLRKEFRNSDRKASTVFMEYLDRLSRNSDWHQGYLLDEMKKFKIKPLFWKQFNSRIERTIMGAISQDGMEQSIQRMALGKLMKAKSGRVTASVAAYGYKIVSSSGEEDLRSRKDSHYAINEDEALVIRYIFNKIVHDGISLRKLCGDLEDKYLPPKRTSHWEGKLLYNFIRNPVYKGTFIANKFICKKVWTQTGDDLNSPGKFVKKVIIRPEEEWVEVPVPAIISAELWELANKTLDKNKIMSSRNGKSNFLLTGLIKCADCGRTFVGGRKRNPRKDGTSSYNYYYRCTSTCHRPKHVMDDIGCKQPQIACNRIDNAVWKLLVHVLLDPKILIGVLDRQYNGETNDHLNNQIAYLKKSLSDKEREDQKLYTAYMADVFNEVEYNKKRKEVLENKSLIQKELNTIIQQTITKEKYAEKKQVILDLCENAKNNGIANDVPFEIKQKVIKSVVDKIILDAKNNTFNLEGVITATFPIDIVCMSSKCNSPPPNCG